MAKVKSQKEIDALNKKFRGMSRETADLMAKEMGMKKKKVVKKATRK